MDFIYAVEKMRVLICRHSCVIKVFCGKRACCDSQFVYFQIFVFVGIMCLAEVSLIRQLDNTGMDEVGQKVCVIGVIKYSECIELEMMRGLCARVANYTEMDEFNLNQVTVAAELILNKFIDKEGLIVRFNVSVMVKGGEGEWHDHDWQLASKV